MTLLNKIWSIVVAVVLALLMIACGKSKEQELADRQHQELNEALESGDYQRASVMADSLAFYVDDLSPEETVSVLMAFLKVHNQANGSDFETMRKYVDVYDIATDLNPNDMRDAFARAHRLNPQIDFEQTALDFRRALAEYDALQSYGDEPETTPTTAAATEPEPAEPEKAEAAIDPSPETE